MAKTANHPSIEQLQAFGLGKLNPTDSAVVERHVEQCEECCKVLRGVPDDPVAAKLKRVAHASESAELGETPVVMVERVSESGAVPIALRDHPRYRIIKPLGRGGMGAVYQAEHRIMERPVALKVLRHRLVANPLAVERFQREVKSAAKLTHPNIVVAHDADQAGDLHFLVMEFVDGLSLAQFVSRKGPLPVPTACLFIYHSALGLQHAAKQGMVHRDIKPQNLMLTRQGKVKILDFGLARIAREAAAPEVASLGRDTAVADTAQGLTEDGIILGTPDYIAPEQVEDSRQADTRSDIYSLGCTFYFLLTGQPPFSGGTVTQTLLSHAQRTATPLHELRHDIPPELERIIDRMMAKSPDDRYQTPGEVAKLLLSFSAGGLAALENCESIVLKRPRDAATDTASIGVAQQTAADPSASVEASVGRMLTGRRWSMLWNRLKYETRKFFRFPHRRYIASVIVLIALVGVLAWVMEAAHRRALSKGKNANESTSQP